MKVVNERRDTMIDENRIPPRVRALGLWHQVVYILVAEGEGKSLYEILEDGKKDGLPLKMENLKTVLTQLKVIGVLRSVSINITERWYCMEAA